MGRSYGVLSRNLVRLLLDAFKNFYCFVFFTCLFVVVLIIRFSLVNFVDFRYFFFYCICCIVYLL